MPTNCFLVKAMKAIKAMKAMKCKGNAMKATNAMKAVKAMKGKGNGKAMNGKAMKAMKARKAMKGKGNGDESDEGDERDGALPDNGKGKGKYDMMIYVRTLSGQERNMRCRKTDTIANVKLGLPIDWATVDPRNIIILKEVEGWRKLPDAQITNGATLYAVNEECINDEDLFNFSKHELPTRWINKLLTGEVNKNK